MYLLDSEKGQVAGSCEHITVLYIVIYITILAFPLWTCSVLYH